MKLSELYRKSADEIRQRGWCRKFLENDKGQVCARGAMLRAAGFTGEMWYWHAAARTRYNSGTVYEADMKLANLMLPPIHNTYAMLDCGDAVADFNNEQMEEANDCIALFEIAADYFEAQGQ